MLFRILVGCFYVMLVLNSFNGDSDNVVIPCWNWDGTNGVCVEKSRCQGFEDAFKQNRTFVSMSVATSTCYANDKNTVCCGLFEGKLIFPSISNGLPERPDPLPSRSDTILYKEVMEKYNNLSNRQLLFTTSRGCGRQQADNPVLLENCTALAESNEFTWLVHILVKEEIDFVCTGILINPSTVLASSNCAAIAQKVRLGVFRLNESQTCTPTSVKDSSLSCLDRVQERDVNLTITNPDIPEFGILKWIRNVRYNDVVRPICLSLNENPRPRLGQLMFVSGWNLLINEGSEITKYKLAYRVIEEGQCKDITVSNIGQERTFCMTGVHNLTVHPTFANTKEPVFYQNGGNWYLAGFQWRTMVADDKTNEIPNSQILGVQITLNTLSWIFDNAPML